MTCEWVEEQLSAYHDGTLDATTNEQVRAHLATCARCPAILADYARFDNAIAHLPRHAPAPELRDRIFNAPAFREILRGDTSDAPAASVPAAQMPTPSARLMPQAARVWLAVLALIVVVSGGTFAIQRILAERDTGPVYAACPHALSAGARLIYRANNQLFSDSDKVVCESHTQVSGLWQVSPDGKWIAYTDATTNTLRLVRSDATGDHEIDANAGAITSLTWSSDGQTILFIKRAPQAGSASVLQVYRAGVQDHSATLLDTLVNARLEQAPAWSPDGRSVALADATPDGIGHNLLILGVHTSVAHDPQSAIFADAGSVTVGHPIISLGWTTASDPQLTWIAGTNNGTATIGSVARSAMTMQSKAVTVATGDISTAAFSAMNGNWAISTMNGTIIQIDPVTRQQTPLAQLGPVASLAWSPDGMRIAAASNGTLWLVAATGATKAGTIDAGGSPAWSADSTRIAFESAGIAQIVDLSTGTTRAAHAESIGSITGMAWSPDGSRLAIWGSQGIALDDNSGATLTTLAGAPVESPQWSQV